MADAPAGKQRLDKWLWYARFFKTRTQAARQVSDGQVRVNGDRAGKPAQTVSIGDVLTFSQSRVVRVVRIEAPGCRRGPAPEAQTLYSDLSPPDPNEGGTRRVGPRPTKKDRRVTEALRAEDFQKP